MNKWIKNWPINWKKELSWVSVPSNGTSCWAWYGPLLDQCPHFSFQIWTAYPRGHSTLYILHSWKLSLSIKSAMSWKRAGDFKNFISELCYGWYLRTLKMYIKNNCYD